jgi:hypothetical protein
MELEAPVAGGMELEEAAHIPRGLLQALAAAAEPEPWGPEFRVLRTLLREHWRWAIKVRVGDRLVMNTSLLSRAGEPLYLVFAPDPAKPYGPPRITTRPPAEAPVASCCTRRVRWDASEAPAGPYPAAIKVAFARFQRDPQYAVPCVIEGRMEMLLPLPEHDKALVATS